jgi:hypothetical protein
MEATIQRLIRDNAGRMLSLRDIRRQQSDDGNQRTVYDSKGWRDQVDGDEVLNQQGTIGLVGAMAGDGLAAHQVPHAHTRTPRSHTRVCTHKQTRTHARRPRAT